MKYKFLNIKRFTYLLKVVLVLNIILLTPQYGFAGGDKNADKIQEQLQTAKYYIDRTMYEDAKKILEKLIISSPQNKDAQVMLVQTYMVLKDYQKSFDITTSLIKNTNDLPAFVVQARADAAMKLKNFVDAKSSFILLSNLPQANTYLKNYAKKNIEKLNFIDDAMSHPKNISLKNIDTAINTVLDEYYPVMTADGRQLLFTQMDGRQEDMFIAYKNTDNTWTIKNLNTLNTPSNEGAASISTDGKMIFFTACNRPDGLGSCDIYYSFLQPNNEFSISSGIGTPINSSAWESQPFYHTQQKMLFFSSNRSGSVGGKDIWMSTLGADNTWQIPTNLGVNVNTDGDEETPFLHPDGVTLYFASNGHLGMGGKDIFMSKKQLDGTWSKPVNLGYPLNSINDENSLFVSTDGQKAYLASTRDSGFGRLDIYELDLPIESRPIPVTYLSASIIEDSSKAAITATFQIIDLATNTVLLSGNTNALGKLLVPLPAGKDYMLAVNKHCYLPYSENFKLIENIHYKPYEMLISLKKPKNGNVFILRNVFFNTNEFALDKKSNIELDKLVNFLKTNPKIKLEISGHTDNTGDKVKNQKLSESRAKSVVEYLISKGITKERLVFKGYGDSQPIATNDTEEGKSQNRRTECKMI